MCLGVLGVLGDEDVSPFWVLPHNLGVQNNRDASFNWLMDFGTSFLPSLSVGDPEDGTYTGFGAGAEGEWHGEALFGCVSLTRRSHSICFTGAQR